jgi:type II secretory pathway predicted ATPase ExeA
MKTPAHSPSVYGDCIPWRKVGLARTCLSAAAVDLLPGASNGNPRLLNLLARAAWIAAAQAGVNIQINR